MARRRGTPPSVGAWHIEETLWGEAQRVRLTTGPPTLVEDVAMVRSIHAVAFHDDGRTLVVGTNEATLRLFQVETGAERFDIVV